MIRTSVIAGCLLLFASPSGFHLNSGPLGDGDEIRLFLFCTDAGVEEMKLNLKALTVACGILWAGAVLVVGLANLVSSQYGKPFLVMLASIYPGYHASGSFGDVIVGTLYALVDGAIFGLILGWLYNLAVGGRSR